MIDGLACAAATSTLGTANACDGEVTLKPCPSGKLSFAGLQPPSSILQAKRLGAGSEASKKRENLLKVWLLP